MGYGHGQEWTQWTSWTQMDTFFLWIEWTRVADDVFCACPFVHQTASPSRPFRPWCPFSSLSIKTLILPFEWVVSVSPPQAFSCGLWLKMSCWPQPKLDFRFSSFFFWNLLESSQSASGKHVKNIANCCNRTDLLCSWQGSLYALTNVGHTPCEWKSKKPLALYSYNEKTAIAKTFCYSQHGRKSRPRSTVAKNFLP